MWCVLAKHCLHIPGRLSHFCHALLVICFCQREGLADSRAAFCRCLGRGKMNVSRVPHPVSKVVAFILPLPYALRLELADKLRFNPRYSCFTKSVSYLFSYWRSAPSRPWTLPPPMQHLWIKIRLSTRRLTPTMVLAMPSARAVEIKIVHCAKPLM